MDVVPPYSTYNKDPKYQNSYQIYPRVDISDFCPIDNLGHNKIFDGSSPRIYRFCSTAVIDQRFRLTFTKEMRMLEEAGN